MSSVRAGRAPRGEGEALRACGARAKIEQWPVRELHTTHTTRQGHRHRHRHRRRHTLRSPQLPREVGRREPDGVRWWGPTQPAPALQRLVLSRRRRSLSKSVALLPVPGATSASLVARASPERGGGGAGGRSEDKPSGWGCREGGGLRASSGKTVDTPAEECSPAAPWVTPSDLAAHAVRRCCQGNVGGVQSRSEETARSQGAAGARRKTDGTASLERAPAGSGRSRDRLKLRPQPAPQGILSGQVL